jgi:5-methylcytosine-specific restriction endonuclease McrA
MPRDMAGPNNPMWGKQHSEEAKKKQSIAKKGKPLSAEHCAKLSAAHAGKPHSAEHRAKNSAAKKGDKNPMKRPEVAAKNAAAQKGLLAGDKHPRWLGGISREPYAWTFNAELKAEVRRRDNHKCQKCGAPQAESKVALPVHHIDYDKQNSDPVNLVALCNSCNSRVNANREHWTVFFRAMATKRDRARI